MVKKLSARQPEKTIDDLFLICKNLEKRLISIENRLILTNKPNLSLPDQLQLSQKQILDMLKLHAKIEEKMELNQMLKQILQN